MSENKNVDLTEYYYFEGENYYSQNNIERAMFCLAQAEMYIDQCENYELIAKIYNLNAIVSMTIGNSSNAMDNYIKALIVSRQHDISYFECMALINIGTLYYGYGEYDKATENFDRALELIENGALGMDKEMFLGVVYQGLGKCALRKENKDLASEYQNKMKILGEKVVSNIGVTMFDAMLANAKGDTKKRDELIKKIASRTDETINIMDLFDDYYEYAYFLLSIEKHTEFVNLVCILEKLADKAGVSYLGRKTAELFIKYYGKIGDELKYLTATRKYYEKTASMEQASRAMAINMMDTRVDLENERQKRIQIQRENEKLTQRSETDALTGLNNRFKLNNTADVKFKKAMESKNFFAIEILDIDYFKQFNDNYGHQEGDKCIKLIADELKNIARKDGVTVYRYGGDEFIVIYEGLTETAVREIAEELKTGITAAHMKHEYSKAADYVTISQGICFEIPRDGENVWNYLHSADDNLYEVKKYSRNSITINRYKE